MGFKLVLALVIASAILVSGFNGLRLANGASAIQPYPISDVYAKTQITSPLDNRSYLGSLVTLNVTVRLCVFACESHPGVIPYQDITCIYSLDGGEWASVPFQFYAWKGVMPSANKGRYYDVVVCFYAVGVMNLSEGGHSIRVAVKPDSLRSYYRENSTLEQSINFMAIEKSPVLTESPPPEPRMQQSGSGYAVAAGVAAIASEVASLGLTSYFKKRKRTSEKIGSV
jgi:hypothetical protein